MSCAPLVSSRTVKPSSQSDFISGREFFWSSGSPPVSSTSGKCGVRIAECGILENGSASSRTSRQDFLQRHLFAFGEGVGGVAVGAAQVAGGEPDENARQPGEGAFALQAQIDFVDDQRVGHGDQFNSIAAKRHQIRNIQFRTGRVRLAMPRCSGKNRLELFRENGIFTETGAMKNPSKRIFAFFVAGFFCVTVRAQNLDAIGVTVLRAVTTNLNGAGIRVAQVEAIETVGTTNFEVNPAVVGQLAARFIYYSSNGSANNFPNSVGGGSGHANGVAGDFYGISGGVATNVAHVDNYEADYFIQNFIEPTPYFPPNISDPVVNQSFTFGPLATNSQATDDSAYDNYAAQYSTLFISAADNLGISPTVSAPGTSYNCISVGAYANFTNYNSIGPTEDNGRCKPDITAPAGETSFSTPQVAGAAAVLMQAGLRGDGGSDTNSAADIRAVKALLLNGAVKPADWTNVAPSPLDYRYGAGVLDVFNSYKQLAGGKHGFIVSTTGSTGGAHPPTGATGTVGVLSGWDFNTNTSGKFPSQFDAVNHYYFDVTNSASNANFTAIASYNK